MAGAYNATAARALELLESTGDQYADLWWPVTANGWTELGDPAPQAAWQFDLQTAQDRALLYPHAMHPLTDWKDGTIRTGTAGRVATPAEITELNQAMVQKHLGDTARSVIARGGRDAARYIMNDEAFRFEGLGPLTRIRERHADGTPLTPAEHRACWLSISAATKPNGHTQGNSKRTDTLTIRSMKKGMVVNRTAAMLNVDARAMDAVYMTSLDASHLCHNPLCINPRHIVLEPSIENQHRKGCQGLLEMADGAFNRGCGHKPYCLRVTPSVVMIPAPAP